MWWHRTHRKCIKSGNRAILDYLSLACSPSITMQPLELNNSMPSCTNCSTWLPVRWKPKRRAVSRIRSDIGRLICCFSTAAAALATSSGADPWHRVSTDHPWRRRKPCIPRAAHPRAKRRCGRRARPAGDQVSSRGDGYAQCCSCRADRCPNG